MAKLSILVSFLKISLHNSLSLVSKTATGYAIGAFGTVQLANVVFDNISTVDLIGLSQETSMQILFIFLLAFFPVVLFYSLLIKKKGVQRDTQELVKKLNTKIEDQRPKICVLPFENLNADSETDFLVDGIVEDLITELSMVHEISVATRKTSFALRGRDFSSKEFKEEWGFDYIVSGCIRAYQQRLRISVELSDMSDDAIVSSNKYDREKIDVFDIQDEIVTKIISSVVGDIEIASLKRACRKPTDNMTSYELMLKGRALNQKFEKQANAEAIEMLDAAIKADQSNPLPYSWKACTIGQAMFLGFREQNEETLEEFLGALSKANELNDNDWNTNRILAEAHITREDYSQAKVYAAKAYRANPNNPHVLSAYGDALLRNDDIDNALKIFEKMYKIEPIVGSDTNSDRPMRAILLAKFLNEQYLDALEIFEGLEEMDFRSWIICVEIHKRLNKEYETEKWFLDGIRKFNSLNSELEIDKMHLPYQGIVSNLKRLSLEVLPLSLAS